MLTKTEREMPMSAFWYYTAGKYASYCQRSLDDARSSELCRAINVKYARLYHQRKLYYIKLAKSE
jgi:hypothetical protein